MRLRAQQSWPPLANTPAGGGRRRLGQVGVGEDHGGRLAAELQGDPLDGPRGPGHDLAAHLGRPGEGDLVHVGVSASRVPTTEPLPVTTWRTPSGRPASRASSARRRAVSGVISAGLTTMVLPVARAGPTFQEVMAMGKFHGTIAATTPERLVEGHVHPTGHGHRGPPVLVDRAGVEVEDLGHHGDLVPALGDGLAHVGRLELGQLLGVLLHLRGEPAHQAGPVGRSHRPPRRAGLDGPGHGLVGRLHPVDRDLGDRPAPWPG